MMAAKPLEAPVIFRAGGIYRLLTSEQNGWNPSRLHLFNSTGFGLGLRPKTKQDVKGLRKKRVGLILTLPCRTSLFDRSVLITDFDLICPLFRPRNPASRRPTHLCRNPSSLVTTPSPPMWCSTATARVALTSFISATAGTRTPRPVFAPRPASSCRSELPPMETCPCPGGPSGTSTTPGPSGELGQRALGLVACF